VFKIGEFSKLSQVTVKTLRYYDKIGLLRPAEVDRFTDYRYYSADPLPRLNRILALKGLGLSLDQIARLLEDDLPPEHAADLIRLKQASAPSGSAIRGSHPATRGHGTPSLAPSGWWVKDPKRTLLPAPVLEGGRRRNRPLLLADPRSATHILSLAALARHHSRHPAGG
jgi:DNA-binding transcriptional MerR regulator